VELPTSAESLTRCWHALPQDGHGTDFRVSENAAVPLDPAGRATGHVHLVGIGGSGMRALAAVLVQRGWRLSGSDLARVDLGPLARSAVCISSGHSAEHLPPGTSLVVRTDALGDENPEIRAARRRGIPVLSYFQMLGWLSRGRPTLAVAGTHGKSTTTAMAADILMAADLDPTVFCGAATLGQWCGGRAGRGELVLAEACEYNANFLHLQPRHAVILGIEPDHFDCYPTLELLQAAFARFAHLVPAEGLLLARSDCDVTRKVAAGSACRVETFGLDGQADWSAGRLTARRGHYGFTIVRRRSAIGSVRLRVPGRHNVLNALAAAALAWAAGATRQEIVAGLERFRGLRRRLEVRGCRRGVWLVDDFAHHPTEIAAGLQTVQTMFPGRRRWCVFQPHQVSRTRRLLDELAASLQNAEKVVVAEIFRAREGPPQTGDVTAADLARRARSLGVDAVPLDDREEILRLLSTHLVPGDVLVTMGAGDIQGIGDELFDRL